MNLEIQGIGFTPNQKLRCLIEKRANKLANRYTWIISGIAILKVENEDKGNDKKVEIKIEIPGNDLFAKANRNEFPQAIDEAMEAIHRQLKKFKERDLIKPRTNPIKTL